MMKTMSTATRQPSLYILGHTPTELDRLREQASWLDPSTRRLLVEAGLTRGMHVLDLGCGLGDVSRLAAEIVGPSGRVIGIDRAAEALAHARVAAAEAGLAQLAFVESDVETLDGLPAAITADAVIGRCILGHVDDAAGVLRVAARRLRPGGLIIMHEPDITLAELTIGRAPLPLLQRVHDWMVRGNAAAGKTLPHAALTLHRTFRQAGLPAPHIEAVTQVECGVDACLPAYLAQLMRGLLPLYERLGVLTAAEVELDTLASRLRSEIATAAPEAVLAMWSFVGAWVRLPVASAQPDIHDD